MSAGAHQIEIFNDILSNFFAEVCTKMIFHFTL